MGLDGQEVLVPEAVGTRVERLTHPLRLALDQPRRRHPEGDDARVVVCFEAMPNFVADGGIDLGYIGAVVEEGLDMDDAVSRLAGDIAAAVSDGGIRQIGRLRLRRVDDDLDRLWGVPSDGRGNLGPAVLGYGQVWSGCCRFGQHRPRPVGVDRKGIPRRRPTRRDYPVSNYQQHRDIDRGVPPTLTAQTPILTGLWARKALGMSNRGQPTCVPGRERRRPRPDPRPFGLARRQSGLTNRRAICPI